MSDQKKHKILIVEDNQENIDLLVYFLRPHGYDIIAVTDGMQALEAVEKNKPDIILLDIMLPKLDGFAVCERLKKDKNTQFIPIIMLTALKELKDKIKSLEVGADDFITKPFENIELLARVRSLLRLKDYHDRLEQTNEELGKKNESLVRMDQFKEELINLIVHDMKNPLFVIQGNLQMMKMSMADISTEFLNKYTSRIERSAQQLLRMVVNLLDISRFEEGTMVLKKEQVNFNDIISEIVERIKEYPENKTKTISLNLDPEIDTMVFDRSVLERVVENMINFASNNVADEGTVKIATHKLQDTELQFSIQDSGTQIPDKYKEKIFEKFSQAEIKNEGYRVERALGLTFCKLAVEAHGGTMWLDPEIRVGNRFVLELPTLETS